MPWALPAKPIVGDATKKTSFADAVIDALQWLHDNMAAGGGGGASLIPNGSFEDWTDTKPASWGGDAYSYNLYSGGSFGKETTAPGHGTNALSFTTSGANGGGFIGPTDMFPVSPSHLVQVSFLLKASAAAMRNNVEVKFYSAKDDATILSTQAVYDSTSNPTSYTRFMRVASPDANARWARVLVYGGVPGTAQAGTAYFDGLEVSTTAPPIAVTESGSISEQTHSIPPGGWQDKGSITLNLPALSSNSFVRVTVISRHKGYGSSRFRIGAVYTAQQDFVLADYYDYNFTFGFTLFGISGPQTMYMQLYGEDWQNPAKGKVDPYRAMWEILSL